ncbi:MAG: tyrosine-type recombinase/integrase [Deltaproteobacteria bacterium]|nr:tyrosine-type recombinase/integrase [Deltaproteobacteria bacterium]
MSQEFNFTNLQQSPQRNGAYHAPIDPPRRSIHPKTPCQPLQLSLFLKPRGPKKKPIDQALDKLSGMEIPAKEHVEAYLRHQYRRNCKASTLRGNLMACELFLSFFKSQGKADISKVTRQDMEGFVEQEMDKGLSIVTVKTRLAGVYAFLRFLYDQDLVDAKLLVKKIRLRLPDPLPKAINPEDVNRLLSVVNHVRDRAMILVLLRTGMRIGELLNTRVNDIDLSQRKITIWQADKNLVGRVVCISDDAAYALEAWLSERDPYQVFLFYGRHGRPLTYQGARMKFAKYIKRAGLDNKGYTPHCLRHTFASEVLNAGMRLEVVQVLLGHSNAEVTRRYARLTDKTREHEYFKAMEIIERGEIDGDYRLDS